MPRPFLGRMLAFAGVALVIAATLTPGSLLSSDGLPPPCIVCNRASLKDFLRNILLFMPLGAGLRLQGASWPRALVGAFALTATVEVLQIHWVQGRDPSFRDLVANVAGAMAGWLGPYVLRHVAVSRRGSRRIRGRDTVPS